MPLRNCLDLIIGKNSIPQEDKDFMLKQSDEYKKQGISDDESDRKALTDYHKKLHDDLNKLKKSIGVKQSAYSPIDKNVAEINKNYDAQKEELKNNLLTQNQTENAIREQSASSVLQHPQSAVGETGSERGRMEQSQQGNETTGTRIEQPKEENQNKGEEENVSGVKKAITQPLRSSMNLPKVELPKMSSDTENLHAAKARVDSGESNPLDLVNRILTDKNGFRNEDEVFDMQYYGHQLNRMADDLKTKYAEAETETDKANVSGQLQQLSDELDRFTQASQTALNKWGKIGNAAQVVVDQGFNPSRERLFIQDAYGGEMPKDVKEKIDAITKERDDAIVEKKRVEELLKQKAAKQGVERIKKDAEKTKKRDETKEKLKEEEKKLIDEVKKAFKRDLGKLNAGIPIPTETAQALGKLAVNYFKQGALTLEALVEKIHGALKDEIDIDKKQIRDIIAEYEPLLVEQETSKLNKKAETIESKITPTILKTKSGELAGVNEPTEFNKPSKNKLSFQKNSEWVKANQRVINAEYKMKVLKRQAFESQKNLYQKGLMWAGRLIRLSVLSGYNILYKLASALTIGGALKRIPEQVIGGIYSQIFKGIAEKAPIEGSLNAMSEAKFYKEFFNPKKFVHNSLEILKTGESDLSKKFGSGNFEHVPVLYLPTDLHQIIKDPAKRATFESSFRNSLIHAEKNGLDINDPLIINSIENAAYKRANYEIFQEQNWLSRKFSAWKSEMEKKGNTGATAKFLADFLIPVSTVPTNIVRRLASTSPLGLIRGSAKVIEAYRAGIESLSNDEADGVMRQLKQGTLGTALWLAGWYGYSHFGGLYSKYDPNKSRKEGTLASDEMEVNGKMIPKPVQHALPLEILQLAATARRIHDNYTDNKKVGESEAIYNSAMGSIGALAEQIPIVEEVGHLIGATSEPYEAKKLKEDVERRFEPQILKETGVIKPDQKQPKVSNSSKFYKKEDSHYKNFYPK